MSKVGIPLWCIEVDLVALVQPESNIKCILRPTRACEYIFVYTTHCMEQRTMFVFAEMTSDPINVLQSAGWKPTSPMSKAERRTQVISAVVATKKKKQDKEEAAAAAAAAIASQASAGTDYQSTQYRICQAHLGIGPNVLLNNFRKVYSILCATSTKYTFDFFLYPVILLDMLPSQRPYVSTATPNDSVEISPMPSTCILISCYVMLCIMPHTDLVE
mmetsp:Transcript_37100/g.89930  ORF Transcript_37100/g.89930 Transcript_37100/m.89930 type:complete len:217 (-) Transcript_37100:1466-2116(-)